MTEKLDGFRLLALFLICSSITVMAQANTPDAALQEMVTTDKPEIFEKHLPSAVQDALDQLPEQDRTQLVQKFFVRNILERQGDAVRKNSNGESWEVVDKKGEVKATVVLRSTFIAGTDAFLLLNVKERTDWNEFMVFMRLEQDEWRLIELGPWDRKSLESEEFMREILPGSRNETAAQNFLNTLNSALQRYARLYPEIGFPANLQLLAGAADSKPAREHAKLLDPSVTGNSMVSHGYEFNYVLTDSGQPGKPGSYRITATPADFGKTGSKSFFSDQSGVIHVTGEARAANDNDPPIGR